LKKFVLGMLCGMALLTATAAAASNEIRALLFPVQVQFMINGEVSTLNTNEVQVLNYKDRLYVPLRSFAEQMGSSVYYYGKQPGHSSASVEVFYEDEHNFTHQDKDGYVRMANLDLQISDDPNGLAPTVNGTILFDKKLPSGKDIVIALLNRNGETIALSETIKLRNQDISKMDSRDMAVFSTHLPYIEPSNDYKLEVQLVDRTPWTFQQADVGTVLDGAGGAAGYPLAAGLIAKYPLKKGEPVELSVMIMNLSKEDSILVKVPIFLEIGIYKSTKDSSSQLIRTLKLEPFSGIIHWKKGYVETTFLWDGKDSDGKIVSQTEEYVASINNLDLSIKGAMLSKPSTVETYSLPSSLKTMMPLVFSE